MLRELPWLPGRLVLLALLSLPGLPALLALPELLSLPGLPALLQKQQVWRQMSGPCRTDRQRCRER